MKRRIITIIICALVCVMSIILCSCDAPSTHNVFVTSENIIYGNTTGNGTYTEGENVVLTAIPKNTSNPFVLWTKDGYIISRENPYTFTANKQTEGKYTAIFANDYLSLATLTGCELTETINNESLVQHIKSLKLYFSADQTYQPKIFEESYDEDKGILAITGEENNKAITYENTEIDSMYTLNVRNTIYGIVELTYELKSTSGTITEASSRSLFQISFNNLTSQSAGIYKSGEISLNKVITTNLYNQPKLTLTFSVVSGETDLSNQ